MTGVTVASGYHFVNILYGTPGSRSSALIFSMPNTPPPGCGSPSVDGLIASDRSPGAIAPASRELWGDEFIPPAIAQSNSLLRSGYARQSRLTGNSSGPTGL